MFLRCITILVWVVLCVLMFGQHKPIQWLRYTQILTNENNVNKTHVTKTTFNMILYKKRLNIVIYKRMVDKNNVTRFVSGKSICV